VKETEGQWMLPSPSAGSDTSMDEVTFNRFFSNNVLNIHRSLLEIFHPKSGV
jgi:hypothetical protein